jgi:hypothetical protein
MNNLFIICLVVIVAVILTILVMRAVKNMINFMRRLISKVIIISTSVLIGGLATYLLVICK